MYVLCIFIGFFFFVLSIGENLSRRFHVKNWFIGHVLPERESSVDDAGEWPVGLRQPVHVSPLNRHIPHKISPWFVYMQYFDINVF